MKDIKKFPICFWFGVPRKFLFLEDGSVDRSRLEEMRESGINLIEASYSAEENKKVLSIAEELGLSVIVQDSRIHKAIRNPDKRRELILDTVQDYKDFPALFSYYVTDEPSAEQFEKLSEIKALLFEADPVHEAYINLYPNYASAKQLGCESYAEHVERFLDTVRPEMLSYDHYHFLKGEKKSDAAAEIKNERERMIVESSYSTRDRAGFFDNFETVRTACLERNIPYTIIILLVEHGPYRNLTEAEIRWEVFQSLAYGTQRMCYFTYWTPGSGGSSGDDVWHWKNGMISKDGERTEHYYDVKRINRDLAPIGDALMGKKSLAVFHTNKKPEPLTRLFSGYDGITSVEGDDVTVGFFEEGLLLIANKSFCKEANLFIKTDSALEMFDTESRKFKKLSASDGGYTVSLRKGDGALIKYR